jgi:hypothetical protein
LAFQSRLKAKIKKGKKVIVDGGFPANPQSTTELDMLVLFTKTGILEQGIRQLQIARQRPTGAASSAASSTAGSNSTIAWVDCSGMGPTSTSMPLRLSELLCNTPWTWASPSSTSFITAATAGQQGQTPKAAIDRE